MKLSFDELLKFDHGDGISAEGDEVGLVEVCLRNIWQDLSKDRLEGCQSETKHKAVWNRDWMELKRENVVESDDNEEGRRSKRLYEM